MRFRELNRAEEQVFPVVAEALRIGQLGRLLLANTTHSLPVAPGKAPTVASLTARQQEVLAHMVATDPQPRGRVPASRLTFKQADHGYNKLRGLYDASTNPHLIRRIVESGDRSFLPDPARRFSRDELAARISPRQLVYFGLMSHGLHHSVTNDVLSRYDTMATEQIALTKIRLWPNEIPVRSTNRALAQAFADGILAPDDHYLTPGYIADGLAVIAAPDCQLAVPEGSGLDHPFPWIADTIAPRRK